MTESPNRTFGEFQAFINTETEDARAAAEVHLSNLSETSVACVDPKTNKGAWNPPGGVIFLANEGLLKRYVTLRRGLSGVLEAHLDCGYMLVVMGLDKQSAQKNVIDDVRKQVRALNKEFGTNFKVPNPQAIGSATPYMKR